MSFDEFFEGKVVLASQSPRRKELLSLIFDSFEVVPTNGEEIIDNDVAVDFIPQKLALNKCREIAQAFDKSLVIGCDTAVILGKTIMGKPKNEADAFRMLSGLSGKIHKVITGTAIYYKKKYYEFSVTTEVLFRQLTDDMIEEYIKTGEPFDKAGGYGIQGKGSLLIEKINGDYFNVVGLPISELAEQLRIIKNQSK